MVPSFHSISAVVGLLFQEERQNGKWHQLRAVLLSLELGIHLLCSCFLHLQLGGGTCGLSRYLVCIPAVISQLPHALVRLQLSEARLNPSLMLLVAMWKGKTSKM